MKKEKSTTEKFDDLSNHLLKVENHLKEVHQIIKGKQVLSYSKVEAMNADITAMVARAANLCWE